MARCVIQTVLVVVIGSMMLLTTTHANTPCVNLIPGAAKLLKGVDITTFDMVPDDIVVSEKIGRRSPVFSFTCNDKRKYRPSGTSNKYDFPDQILHVDTLPGSWSTSEIKHYTSGEDMRNDLNVKVGIKGRYSKYTFSSSSFYKHTLRSIVNASQYVQDVSSYQSTSTMELYPSGKITLNDIFKQEIEKLNGSFETNPNVYRKFIQRFGTHYVEKAMFGGLLIVHQEIDKRYASSEIQKRLSTEAAAAIDKVASVNVGVSSGNSHGTTSFEQFSTSKIKIYGGDETLLERNGKRGWKKSVKKDPWLISGVLSPISDLIIGNDKKKANLDKAVMDHLLHSYLDELLRLVEAMKLKIDDERLVVFESKIFEMQNDTFLEEEKVEKLKTDIDYQLNVPLWFKNNVKLCIQCLPEARFCSSFNQNIQLPNYESCGNSFLSLSVGNESPSWFKKTIELCLGNRILKKKRYSICPKMDDIQNPSCASANRYYKVIHSNKQLYEKEISGTCSITSVFTIKFPNFVDVPIWAKKFKICYFLESENGGKCDTDASSIQCSDSGEKLILHNPDMCRLRLGFYTLS